MLDGLPIEAGGHHVAGVVQLLEVAVAVVVGVAVDVQVLASGPPVEAPEDAGAGHVVADVRVVAPEDIRVVRVAQPRADVPRLVLGLHGTGGEREGEGGNNAKGMGHGSLSVGVDVDVASTQYALRSKKTRRMVRTM